MEVGQMKNIVILKNLPSNIVEEAIVVLKPNLKTKSVEHIEKISGKSKEAKKTSTKNYIIGEAESVISNYLAELDKQKDKNSKSISKINKKYKIQKILSTVFGAIIIINVIMKIFT